MTTDTKDTDEKNNPGKIPLKWRLIAWWKGYSIADVEARMRLQQQEAASGNDPSSKEKTHRIFWDSARIQAAQLIWGEGFCQPGGSPNVIDSSKLLALAPKMSLLVIGAGLGGSSRTLAREFGVWINGYEDNQLLAEEAMKISLAAAMGKKASVTHCDLNNPPISERSFDRAFCEQTLFTIENKAGLIKKIFDRLNDDSLFLISDYIIRDHDCLSDPDVIDWSCHEPLDPYLITSEEMKAVLERAGFTVRIHEDITDHYLDMINAAWENTEKTMAQLAENNAASQENILAIQREIKLWTHRTKIMRAGKLRLHRYLALKSN